MAARLLLCALLACTTIASAFDEANQQAQTAVTPQRIVSLVPAVTEMLFAIGAGPQVVGVSSFDRYPPEVSTRTRVGALLDPDVERILSLRPHLVVIYGSQDDLARQLQRAAIPAFPYRHGGVSHVTDTIRQAGALTGHATEAARLTQDIANRLAKVRATVAGRPRPRVLLVFGREPGTLRNIYASGGTGFLHEMLTIAGGANVFADVGRESVQATSELILARRPDIILEVRASADTGASMGASPDRAWDQLSSVPAVRAGHVIGLQGDEFVVPGPRVAEGVEKMAKALEK